jgi:hypothetical protein
MSEAGLECQAKWAIYALIALAGIVVLVSMVHEKLIVNRSQDKWPCAPECTRPVLPLSRHRPGYGPAPVSDGSFTNLRRHDARRLTSA